MNIETVINLKGGVGKTTTVANYGYMLSQKGFKTLMIDLDNQGNLSSLYQPEYKRLRPSMAEFFSQRNFDINRCINQASINGQQVENLYIAHANASIATAIQSIPIRGPNRSKMLERAFGDLSNDVKFDYILIDCPPNADDSVINALVASTKIIVPIEIGGFADDSIQSVLELICDSKGYMSPIEVLEKESIHFVLNKVDGRTSSLNKDIEQSISPIKDFILNTPLRISTTASKSIRSGLPLEMYNKRSRLVEDFNSFIEEVRK